jgi:hypothetical protein
MSSSSSSSSSSITFLRPKQTLSADVLEQYRLKIQPYKVHWVNRLYIGGEGGRIETAPGTYEEYKEGKMYRSGPKIYIHHEMAQPSALTEAYLFDFESKDEKDFDAMDRLLCATDPPAIQEYYQLYGYHTYGGYWGFFRPDLTEVIHLLQAVVPLSELGSINRLYVTTEAYPSLNVNVCYDREQDMHRARTTVYVVQNAAPGGAGF